jgi:CheY-like chemotaxis protein
MCELINVQVNVMVAMSMLKRLGLAADVAYNGLEAIKALQTKCYDLVWSHNSLH